MASDVFPWQKLIDDEAARLSPNPIRRALAPREMTPADIEALRREWNKMHSGLSCAFLPRIWTNG